MYQTFSRWTTANNEKSWSWCWSSSTSSLSISFSFRVTLASLINTASLPTKLIPLISVLNVFRISTKTHGQNEKVSLLLYLHLFLPSLIHSFSLSLILFFFKLIFLSLPIVLVYFSFHFPFKLVWSNIFSLNHS